MVDSRSQIIVHTKSYLSTQTSSHCTIQNRTAHSTALQTHKSQHITSKNSPEKHIRLRYKDNKTQYTTHHIAPQHKPANDNILFHTAEQ